MIDDELRQLLGQMRADIISQVHGEIDEFRRHVDVRFEATNATIRLVAEGVLEVREELGRAEARLDAKIDRTAAETHDLIRVSYGALDRRLQAIEQSR